MHRILILAWALLHCGGLTLPDDDAGGNQGVDASFDAGALPQISAGTVYTCAVIAGGAWCWGADDMGQVTVDGPTPYVPTPFAVPGLPPLAAIHASFQESTIGHTCAVSVGGDLYCWGSNYQGEIGNGTMSDAAAPITKVLGGVVAVSGGADYTCSLSSDGGVQCWGFAMYGQLGIGPGDGGLFNTTSPLPVVGLPPASAITTGSGATCAIAGGHVWCWGGNAAGEIGTGDTVSPQWVPVEVAGLSNVTSIAVGSLHACAVASGQVWCWGYNGDGALGDGKKEGQSLEPVAVHGLTNAVSVTAGRIHTCALTTANTVYCWGDNQWAELGDGTTTERDVPFQVPGLPPVAAVSAGYLHTCVVTTAGKILCWGDDQFGEVGDGIADGGFRHVLTATPVVGLP